MQLRMQRSKSSTGNARTSSLGCEEENETLKEEAWGPDVLVCIGARRASKAQEEQEEADEKKKNTYGKAQRASTASSRCANSSAVELTDALGTSEPIKSRHPALPHNLSISDGTV